MTPNEKIIDGQTNYILVELIIWTQQSKKESYSRADDEDFSSRYELISCFMFTTGRGKHMLLQANASRRRSTFGKGTESRI